MSDNDKVAAAAAWLYSNIAYVTDDSRFSVDDYWFDAVGTLAYEQGDSEDIAMLLHSLLLAGGISTSRIRTYFGYRNTVEYAWVTYRRDSDNEWVVIDATLELPSAINSLPTAKINGNYTDAWGYLMKGGYTALTAGQYPTSLQDNEGIIILPSMTLSIEASMNWAGQGTLPAFTGLGYGNFFATGEFVALTCLATGRVSRLGALDAKFSTIRISATGVVEVIGVSDFNLFALECAATGVFVPIGASAANLPAVILDGYGVVEDRLDDYVLRHAR